MAMELLSDSSLARKDLHLRSLPSLTRLVSGGSREVLPGALEDGNEALGSGKAMVGGMGGISELGTKSGMQGVMQLEKGMKGGKKGKSCIRVEENIVIKDNAGKKQGRVGEDETQNGGKDETGS
ncbi:hypothetical protein K2173_005560 [Erythroxylum novogranatense]|uniref:Uncharacterized protein n=1 Tax=Erythroxylum novogranatense TaxID=1862640 RepID=A0AAV8SKZ6_9ROSI|nr:hypothetical protein K2173_005560 [Erythroxylum novogranatense]